MSRPAAPRVPGRPGAPRAATRPSPPERTREVPVQRSVAPDRPAPTSAIGGAPRWVSGVLAGVQAAVLSALAVATPALAAYVATSADPANADVAWTRSVAVGGALWLMGHGGALQAATTTMTIVPLGITALALFAAHASARRSAHPTLGAWAAGVGGYLVTVALVVALVGGAGPAGAGAGAVVRTLVGAMLVAALGLGSGILRPGTAGALAVRLLRGVPDAGRAVVRAGALAASALVAVAALVVVGWAMVGRAATGDVIEGLGLDTFSGLVMAVGQLAFAPNLVLWALAWLAGPGFAVGEGTVFAPAEVTSGPLPALPLLGALPTEPSPAGRWVVLVVVGVGALAGWWLHRRLTAASAWRPVLAAVGAGGVAGLVVAALTALAGGAAGPGRMAQVGGSPLLVGACVAGLVAAGALLVAVPADAAVRAAVGRGWGRVTGRVRGAAGAGAGHRRGAVPDAAEDGLEVRASDR